MKYVKQKFILVCVKKNKLLFSRHGGNTPNRFSNIIASKIIKPAQSTFNSRTLKVRSEIHSPYANYSLGKVPKIVNATEKQLENNIIVTLNTKKGKKASLHPEVFKNMCNYPGCSTRLCIGLCGKPQGSYKSVGHVTHGDPDGSVPLSNTDFQGNPRKQKFIPYETPHELENPPIEKEATERLNKNQKALDIIHEHAKDK